MQPRAAFQVVAYRDGQQFKAHHDAGTLETDSEAGSDDDDDDDDDSGGSGGDGGGGDCNDHDGNVNDGDNVNESMDLLPLKIRGGGGGGGCGGCDGSDDCSGDPEVKSDKRCRKKKARKKRWRVRLVAPRRLVTFFVYLNSLPPGQGATTFPALGIEVGKPKIKRRGRVERFKTMGARGGSGVPAPSRRTRRSPTLLVYSCSLLLAVLLPAH